MIGFDQPVYHVREDAGEVELTVQLLGSRVPVIDRPVVFTYYTEDRNATSTFTINQHLVLCIYTCTAVEQHIKYK